MVSSSLYLPALWYHSHFTYQCCGIFPTLPTSVVASSPLYLPALWHLPHFTYQRCSIFPTLPTSVVASSPLYLPALWHHSQLIYQRFGKLHCLLQYAFRTQSDQYTYRTVAEDWAERQLLDGQTLSLPSRSAQKPNLVRLSVLPDKPD